MSVGAERYDLARGKPADPQVRVNFPWVAGRERRPPLPQAAGKFSRKSSSGRGSRSGRETYGNSLGDQPTIRRFRLMDVLAKTSRIVGRLAAGAALVAFAAEVLPRLVSDGVMSASTASVVLRQIPQLREDFQRQIDAAAESLNGLQDRVEVLGQFLLLHQDALSGDEQSELERLLAAVRD